MPLDHCPKCKAKIGLYRDLSSWGNSSLEDSPSTNLVEGLSCKICGHWIEPEEVPAENPFRRPLERNLLRSNGLDKHPDHIRVQDNFDMLAGMRHVGLSWARCAEIFGEIKWYRLRDFYMQVEKEVGDGN